MSKTRVKLGYVQKQVFQALQETGRVNHPYARDFAPLFAQRADGQLVLIDQNFETSRPISGRVPYVLSKAWGGSVQRVSLPIYNTPGNISCSESECFIGDWAIYQNGPEQFQRSRTFHADDEVVSEADIKLIYEQVTGQRFHFVGHLPFEMTGHIDFWVKHVAPKTILLASLSEQTISTDPRLPQSRVVRGNLFKIRKFLLERRTFFETKLGYEVIDVPMMLPLLPNRAIATDAVLSADDIIQDPSSVAYFYSYINSLLIHNMQGQKTAIVPRYRDLPRESFQPEAGHHFDENLIGDPNTAGTYEYQVERAYQQAGYQVVWVKADTLIQGFGAFHCAGVQIPFPQLLQLADSYGLVW